MAKIYHVRTEMHVQGHMKIEANSKSEAAEIAKKKLTAADPHKALDMIEIDRGSDKNIDTRSRRELGVYFYIPRSWVELEK